MDEAPILYSAAGGVARIVLNRPQSQNSLDAVTATLFVEAVARAEADAAVRVVVIAANGRSFCSGGDFNWVLTWPGLTQEARQRGAAAIMDAVQCLYDMSKPSIARVQGAAVGGGVGLMLACDWAIASERARIGLTSVRNGLLAGIAIPGLIQAVGARRARQLLTHGGVHAAAAAAAMGLLDRVVPDANLDAAIDAFCDELMLGAPGVQALIKTLIRDMHVLPADQEMASAISRHVAEQANGREAQAGMAAFLEKRKPQWVPS